VPSYTIQKIVLADGRPEITPALIYLRSIGYVHTDTTYLKKQKQLKETWSQQITVILVYE